MFAVILRHKATVGVTPPGVLILHETHEPVLVGSTPLSKVLLNDYGKGFRFFVYDRTLHTRRERVVPPKNFDLFMKAASVYYAYAKMEIETISYTENETRNIIIDDSIYELGELLK
jgi:hypothetical protein